MDIRFLNQALNGRITELDSAELLARLRAAGKVEAVVISRLADSLLLQTPLGRIETADRLQFQPGDRLELRVAGTPEQPVLKARQATAQPRVLDIATNPLLREILPANRAQLASVVRIMAESTLIRITDRLLTLSTRLEQPRGHLLSLTRDPLAQTVSIEPIERKRLYLALIRQLLPRQLESRPVDLVRFYRLAVEAAQAPPIRPHRGVQPPAASSQAGERAASAVTARTIAADASPRARHSGVVAQPPPLESTLLPRASLPAGRLSLESGTTIRALRPAPWQTAALRSTAPDFTVKSQASSAAEKSLRAAFTRAASIPPALAGTKLAQLSRAAPGAVLARTAVAPALDAGRPASAAGRSAKSVIERDLRLPRRPGISGTSPSTARAEGMPVRAALPATNRPGSAAIGAAGPALPAASAPLTQLLAALPSLHQLDAATLRRWFEDLGFVRPVAGAPARPGGGPLPLLRALNQGDSLLRGLLNLATPTGKTGAAKDNQGTRNPSPETLLPWAREGIRLVEQALSQNLLQRASLGLQQETQQPASLGFALPVLDEQQVKPLQIELAQKQSTRDASGSAWEVHVDFDFAGLGPVSCHVVLDGFSVAASFYCALEQTRERVEQALPELRRQLDAAGFVATELHGFSAAASPARSAPAGRVDGALLDVEA